MASQRPERPPSSGPSPSASPSQPPSQDPQFSLRFQLLPAQAAQESRTRRAPWKTRCPLWACGGPPLLCGESEGLHPYLPCPPRVGPRGPTAAPGTRSGHPSWGWRSGGWAARGSGARCSLPWGPWGLCSRRPWPRAQLPGHAGHDPPPRQPRVFALGEGRGTQEPGGGGICGSGPQRRGTPPPTFPRPTPQQRLRVRREGAGGRAGRAPLEQGRWDHPGLLPCPLPIGWRWAR